MSKKHVFGILLLCTGVAHASVGLIELPSLSDAGPVTIFYPSSAKSKIEHRGAFEVDVAADADPVKGNGRLIVISHGSPASPWVYSDLARTLVSAGFIVAMPEHFADNNKNDSEPGLPSWKRRPVEVSRAIDRMASDERFQPLLQFDKVGMYGMSAGGHTALTLAGGRWSPAKLREHCDAHIADDFQACAGLATSLTGGLLDGIKIALIRWFLDMKLSDTAWYAHTDSRIAAIVSGVPFAADFDPASLQQPPIPLGIITARLDKWLSPTFHGDAILKACMSCEYLVDLKTGGHGALLSPLPPNLSGLVGEMVSDPPGFNRASVVPEINGAIVSFFVRHLLSSKVQ